MRNVVAILCLLAAGVAVSGTARAQEPVYVVTHIDLAMANAAPGAALLKEFGAETRKEPGCLRFEVLQQDGRPNHFTVVGVWKDRKAFEAHDASAWTKAFREKVQPMIGSPWDERLHKLLK